jgi:phosphate transport system substrate-binding protein
MLLLFFFSCGNNKKEMVYDTPLKGSITISVDESFKPVIEQQIQVYEGTYPNAHIHAVYKPEAECFRDLQGDSTRMIIVAKSLTDREDSAFKAALSYKVQYDVVAYDAVDVIVSLHAKDSVFTEAQLKNYLSGKDTSLAVVVDGNKATSTVRFLMDSLLKGKSFGNNVKAAAGSKAVLDYIATHDNAIGFVGSSWVGNDEDPEQAAYMRKIKPALIECKTCEPGTFAKPSQATISYAQYPLVRPLYFVLKENYTGLGTGFTNFLSLERGQLVFRRSYLVPAKIYFGIRKSNISNF